MSDPQPPAWTPGNQPQHPQYGVPPQNPQYGVPPQQPYGQQPPYHQQPHYGPPQQPTQRLPQYEQLQYTQPQLRQRPPTSKSPWLLAAGIAVAVALIGGVGVVLATRGGSDEVTADAPMPTATYTDGLTSASTPSPTEPTESPTYTPEPTPTPTTTPERRRTLKDVDQGVLVYDDVYVKPASGWTRIRRDNSSVLLGSRDRTGVLFAVVDPVGYSPAESASSVVKGLITGSRMTGVQQKPAKTLSPMNSNISAQAEVSFSGRIRTNGVSVSVVGRCTAMTGVESIHNVTVTVCVEARKDVQKSVFREADRMLSSVARSI